MAFPKSLLNDNEEVVLDLRPHWAMLFWSEVLVVVLLAATIATAFVASSQPRVALVPGVALLVAVVMLLRKLVMWNSKNFVVTNQRIIHREGVFAKSGIEMALDRIEDIRFKQSILEKMLGAGDLMIESAGESGQNVFGDIRKPEVVKNEISRQREAHESRRFTGGAAAAPISGVEQLEKLHGLLKAGAITQGEFDAQKAKLLS